MYLKRYLTAALALAMLWCGLGIEPAFAAYNMPYYIDVDITNQIVTIYNTKDRSIARQMLCTTGENTNTPTGTFYLPATGYAERGEWYYMIFDCWAKYATRIYKGIMFHSITYDKNDEATIIQEAVEEFGTPASHGCIRLRVADAKFIADKCLPGTCVRIYYSDMKNEALRRRLFEATYIAKDGVSYRDFLGIPEDALWDGDQGDDVRELQLRLGHLGYLEGEPDGKYAGDTIQAVMALQRDLGLRCDGVTTPRLREVIFSDEAPVAVNITLRVGDNGPAVRQLQQVLADLGIYAGELDSVYDEDVRAAVKELQSFCGYEADGVATPEIQHLAFYERHRIRAQLGEDFTAERVSEDVNMGTMSFKEESVNVRAKASTNSDVLTTLSLGDKVIVLATKGDWAQVLLRPGSVGYMYNQFLSTSTEQNELMRYSGNGETITLGATLEQLTRGKTSDERSAFLNAYAQTGGADYLDAAVRFATIDTGADGVTLNLRAEPDGEADVLAQLPNGTKLRALGQADGYTRVGYDDQIGYLADDYLRFTEGTAAEVTGSAYALAPEEGAGQKVTAVVMSKEANGSVKVYKDARSGAKVLGTLGWGKRVKVLSDDEAAGWALIEYKGKQGYMEDIYLTYMYAA